MQKEANFGWSRPGHRGAGRAGSLHAEKKDVKDVIPCAAMSETQSNCWKMSPARRGDRLVGVLGSQSVENLWDSGLTALVSRVVATAKGASLRDFAGSFDEV